MVECLCGQVLARVLDGLDGHGGGGHGEIGGGVRLHIVGAGVGEEGGEGARDGRPAEMVGGIGTGVMVGHVDD